MKKILWWVVAMMMMGLFGCAKQTYKLQLDGYGFSPAKEAYAEGAAVKVTYDLIATDTDYSFYLDCEDAELTVDYQKGAYVITFLMPAHDVTLTVEAKNTMTMDAAAL